MERIRDKRGRFTTRLKAPALDPAFVRRLGEGRPAVQLWRRDEAEIVILSKRSYTYEIPEGGG